MDNGKVYLLNKEMNIQEAYPVQYLDVARNSDSVQCQNRPVNQQGHSSQSQPAQGPTAQNQPAQGQSAEPQNRRRRGKRAGNPVKRQFYQQKYKQYKALDNMAKYLAKKIVAEMVKEEEEKKMKKEV